MKMKKKARIITFHCVPNYGAVLQAYALSTVLKKYFDDVKIIDYRPLILLDEYAVINTFSAKSILYSLFSARQFKKKLNKFQSFRDKYLDLTNQLDAVSDSNCDGEDVFLGSDQIWNANITGGLDEVYFGILKNVHFDRCISYAASVGKSTLTELEQNMMKKYLENIDCISVRENEAKELLADYTSKTIEVVLDPTLLLTKNEWEKLVVHTKKIKYVLFYSLNGYDEAEILAKKTARYFNLPLIEISGGRKSLIKKNHEVIYTAGPIELISLIHDADFVVTDSFHGTVFSILFERSFVTFPHKTRGGRIKNILDKTNLNRRLTTCFNKTIVNEKIDWVSVNERLIAERNNSIKFIEQSL